ncbi:unnamed protein product [Prorocentrum cordatum]|uniref:Uncharacterized protein n=1 Tax=Prorocentrum cordatum TaxID=2364126 RepID=A0ABN9VVM9_9DINO|nr:unnamed protein product [Polarella glacialis]
MATYSAVLPARARLGSVLPARARLGSSLTARVRPGSSSTPRWGGGLPSSSSLPSSSARTTCSGEGSPSIWDANLRMRPGTGEGRSASSACAAATCCTAFP